MASSAQKRRWFPEFVTRNIWPLPVRCDNSTAKGFPIPTDLVWFVHPAVVEAFRALGQVMDAYGVSIVQKGSGTLSCRRISGSVRTSLHAHGIAIDINPDPANVYREKPAFPDGFVEAVLAIRSAPTDEEWIGQRVFKWLGPDFDRPHFEIDIPRGFTIDWSTVANAPKGLTMDDVMAIQRALNASGFGPLEVDGDLGPKTEAALTAAWQAAPKVRREFDIHQDQTVDQTHPLNRGDST